MKASEKQKAKMYAIIESWRNSDKSQKEICKAAGISFHVFTYWHKKLRSEQSIDEKQSDNTGEFLPVSIKDTFSLEELQISYPNGVTIICPRTITTSQVKELIKLF